MRPTVPRLVRVLALAGVAAVTGGLASACSWGPAGGIITFGAPVGLDRPIDPGDLEFIALRSALLAEHGVKKGGGLISQ